MAATTTPLRKGAELGNGTVWLIPSARIAGVVYTVVWVEKEWPGLIDGHWICDCAATSYCIHIREAAGMRGDAA